MANLCDFESMKSKFMQKKHDEIRHNNKDLDMIERVRQLLDAYKIFLNEMSYVVAEKMMRNRLRSSVDSDTQIGSLYLLPKDVLVTISTKLQ